MLKTLEQVKTLINEGRLLHISGSEPLLRQLPKGTWAGGSTEYFMANTGGKVTDEELFVTDFTHLNAPGHKVVSYGPGELKNVAKDAYDNGFTILIVPFDSEVHKEYAKNAAAYDGIFMKCVAGWIAGLNLGKSGQTPIAVNGIAGEATADKAVALHVALPEGKTAGVNIINIFEQDENSPLIRFIKDGFAVEKCLIDGVETVFADYLAQNKIDTNLPLIGDYSGNGINISFRAIENGIVNLYAPVFTDIEYRLAKNVGSYAEAFNNRLAGLGKDAVFLCNCILNFLYGELENKQIEALDGPITFGEIAYQLVNQTLVYITVS